MAQRKHYFSTILVLFASLLFPSYDALEFDVGGNEGWVLNPSENYKHWAGRLRFQVNDTLLFRYEKGRDSVMEVGEDDYKKCNTENPIKKMDDGYSVFMLDRSGPFYFISGNQENCETGQKIIVVVLAVRNHNAPHLAPPPSDHSPVAAPPKGCSSSTSSSGHAPWAEPPKGSSATPPSSDGPSATPPKGSSTISPSEHAPRVSPPGGSPPTPSSETSTVTPPKGCSNTPPIAPPKGSSAVPPSFHAPAKPPTPEGTPKPPSATPSSTASSNSPSSTTSASPTKSPLPGEGCNDSSVRSDPANVHKSPAGSPPKSTSAAPAAIHLSSVFVVTLILNLL